MKRHHFHYSLIFLAAAVAATVFLWPYQPDSQESEAASGSFRPFVVGQGVELHAQGIVIGDGEVLLTTTAVRNGATTSTKLDAFLRAMEQSFDALEFRIQTDIETPRPETTAVANAFIQRAHDFGLKVGLNYWRYPSTLVAPSEFQAKKLNDQGRLVDASLEDDDVINQHIDKANPAALEWFGERLRMGIATVPNFDFVLVVEDKVSSWVQSDEWPQRVRYWDSPTYSDEALESFRAYQVLQGRSPRLLPVDRSAFVRFGRTELAGPNDELWTLWYGWRFEVFANYLATIRASVREVRPAARTMFMSWQRTIDEAVAVRDNDWTASQWKVGLGRDIVENAVFGVSVRTLARRKTLDDFIIEYGEDGTRWGWPMSLNRANTRDVRAALRNSGIRFGTFVQLYNYSDGQSVIPEFVVDSLKMARSYYAKTVVVYDVATVFEQSSRYNAELTAYWRYAVAQDFIGFDNHQVITTIRRELQKARVRQLNLDPNRPGPPGMPSGIGAWYDRNGTIYVTGALVKNRLEPFYVVTDHWDNPRRTPENWFEEAPDRDYITIARPDLLGKRFQIVDRYQRWAPIAETPGMCTLKGIICRPGTWLISPVSWKTINWNAFGWRPS